MACASRDNSARTEPLVRLMEFSNFLPHGQGVGLNLDSALAFAFAHVWDRSKLAIDWLSVTRQAAPNPDGFSSSTAARLSGLTQTVSPSKPRARGKLALALGRRFTGSGEQFCPRLVVGFDKSGHIECRAGLKRLDGRDGM